MAGESSSVKVISLSLTAQYAPSWKTWEGVRELVQNWHDGVFASLEKMEIAPSAKSKVAFLSCKENDPPLQVYKAVLQAGNSSEDTNSSATLTNRTQKCVQTFDFTLSDHRKEEGGVELGRIVYSPTRERLTLINYDTELMRKVLLLGFSKKASSKEVIGQFGEGLKVGALALVREGRVVSMETSKDRWKFGLSHDEAFDEEVLTVFVDERWKERYDDDDDDNDDLNLGQTDTRVSVFPLCLEHWELYVKRFLFLCPPSDCFKSEIGTLLVDACYKGQLYVKGVWVSDLSQDGLASGVDLVHLKIDRDRRAVIHLSEIDHQISSMWVQAIQQRPELVPYYYQLLEQNKTSDVRHANFYISAEAAFLIAQQYFAIHGQMTYPIPNSVSPQKLNEIKQEIEERLVLCNQSLIDVLYKSGAVETLEAILSRATTKTSFLVPYAELTKDEIDVLQHVEKLVQLCYPEFSLTSMDIDDSAERVIFQKEFGHYKIPRALLSGKADHCCKQSMGSSTKCFCREALIATKILSLQPQELVQGSTLSSNTFFFPGHLSLLPRTNDLPPSKTYFYFLFPFLDPSIGECSSDGCSDGIVKLVASLSMQVCRMNPPFCEDLHGRPQSSQELPNPSLLKMREEMLQKEKDLLSENLLEKDRNHSKELLQLQAKIYSLEKDLVNQQVKFVNIEQEVSEAWRKRIEELKLKMADLSNTITDLKRDKKFYQEKLASTTEDLKSKQRAYPQQVSILNDKSDILRKRLADKFDKLSQIVLASKQTDDSVADVLKTATKEIEEMWSQKDNCIICTIQKPNCVVIPCRHQITCFECTSFLATCSYCRGPILDRILTYGL